MVLRLSEVYSSVQGEGPKTGLPTTFVRFAGCNLRCPGWPCDTQHAIDPQFYKDWEKVGVSALVERVPTYPNNVCITGGEPFLQDRVDLEAFIAELLDRRQTVEVFSNGTRAIPGSVMSYVGVQLDWKLVGSGEGDRDIDQRVTNVVMMQQTPLPNPHGIKFVISDLTDFVEAKYWYEYLKPLAPSIQFWAGVVWGKEWTDDELVRAILENELPWRLNVQMHKHVWEPDKRAV
jgi:7-carboxy-7-deazaguanine synthase